ncbi:MULTISPECIES: MarR family winged helix-turn-helix transcriptional regulator [unclassified Brevundimonas]|jgi:DNA-binding MarR family transcriptional regulator|uniref:MarR family winged helix-turn-helix transcriptional regulator n=1 Tax=unclassified Brevundimonas TaxID=2622653 RepID=UPI000CFDC4DC|nr:MULTISPECIES: helix-turn-helix domain-containing protein [unclassified Brevundimonas]PRA29129.1 MarR family transcriptional regulator [Brevundimonas sp. MYb27]PQZ84823.1 MarR family transcriptional regulator [Brevundimonas sp. MYb31]PRB14585.1 MarR family transcriptional regulator [Brevundimonas sp. MYb52]PRB36642.1 MarR family transcriptional regulator [Brevundimonas sp. MYb46]PRB55659.1 MarR family transcriptional regulator [Brevundimonas sp. MYb33]
MIFNSDYLIVPLLAGFEWFDESLQMSLREAGWPHLTRPESMVMMHVQMEVVRPADIARSLRLTRQAVHSTINSLVERGVFELVDDPTDGRIRIVQLTPMGKAMRRDAQKIVAHLTEELGRRIGARRVKALRESFAGDWGAPIVHTLDGPDTGMAAFRQD